MLAGPSSGVLRGWALGAAQERRRGRYHRRRSGEAALPARPPCPPRSGSPAGLLLLAVLPRGPPVHQATDAEALSHVAARPTRLKQGGWSHWGDFPAIPASCLAGARSEGLEPPTL